MNLHDLVLRAQLPIPWQEGDNIPWHESGFSERMLAEHLTQDHDRASRRTSIIDQQVAWIHHSLLQERPTRILDLGCGPGLYCNQLAARGHTCLGIDFSPASIAYAEEQAIRGKLTASYHLADMRSANYGDGYGLAMLLFGELNVFSRADAKHILAKAYAALRPGGLLLLEPHTDASLIPEQQALRSWYSSSSGLFSPLPHLVLIEQHWDWETAILTRRYYVVDAATAAVTRYAQSMQTYSHLQYQELLTTSGFTDIALLPGLAYDRLTPAPEFLAIVARKPN